MRLSILVSHCLLISSPLSDAPALKHTQSLSDFFFHLTYSHIFCIPGKLSSMYKFQPLPWFSCFQSVRSPMLHKVMVICSSLWKKKVLTSWSRLNYFCSYSKHPARNSKSNAGRGTEKLNAWRVGSVLWVCAVLWMTLYSSITFFRGIIKTGHAWRKECEPQLWISWLYISLCEKCNVFQTQSYIWVPLFKYW